MSAFSRTENTLKSQSRDPDYSAEKSGYHPVEILLKRKGDEWHILHITDFFYVRIGPYAELFKDLYFDFGTGLFQTQYENYRIEEASDIYPVWEQNFCCYFNNEIFKVSAS